MRMKLHRLVLVLFVLSVVRGQFHIVQLYDPVFFLIMWKAPFGLFRYIFEKGLISTDLMRFSIGVFSMCAFGESDLETG